MDANDKKLSAIGDLLKSHKDGLTITDVMKKTGFARHTVLTRLYFMMGHGDVSMRRINMAKLHYWIGEAEKNSEDVKMTPLAKEHIKKVLVSPLESVEREKEIVKVGDKERELAERERVLAEREKALELNEKSARELELEKRERELENREKKLKEDVVEEKVEEKIEEAEKGAVEPVEKVDIKPKEPVVVKNRDKLDMVAIKRYIRGEVPLESIQRVSEVKNEVGKEVPLVVMKKPELVVGKLDMASVKEEIRGGVNSGELNKAQAQVLEQRAPVSHVVEGTVHPEKVTVVSGPKKKKKEFILTGVPGFDGLFDEGKGLPKGAAILVAGGAGSGKTLLCLQTMINRANMGEKCLFMSFEESEDRLVEHMEMFGWNPRELIKKGTLLIKRFNPYEITRSVDALLMKAKGELLIEVDPIVFPEDFKPDIIVVDSLTAIASAFTQKEDSYRIYIEQLFRFFENLGATAFLITETKQIPTVYSTTGVEEFLADGVIVIYNFKRGNTRENALEILKMRGVKHQKKIVAMRINDNGMTVYPDQEVYGGIEDK